MATPTSAFQVAKSIFAGMTVVRLVIGAETLVFESKLLKHKIDQTKKQLKRPDASGIMRVVRNVVTEQTESFILHVDEIKRLLDVFGDKLAGSADSVTATIWIPDPQDSAGKVALKSEEAFTCSVIREGDLDFGNSEFSEANLVIEVQEDHLLTFTADGDQGS